LDEKKGLGENAILNNERRTLVSKQADKLRATFSSAFDP
jgi:hypothetical protein